LLEKVVDPGRGLPNLAVSRADAIAGGGKRTRAARWESASVRVCPGLPGLPRRRRPFPFCFARRVPLPARVSPLASPTPHLPFSPPIFRAAWKLQPLRKLGGEEGRWGVGEANGAV